MGYENEIKKSSFEKKEIFLKSLPDIFFVF